VGVRVTFPLSREYTTVAGLVLAGLGRLPEGPGERVRLPGLTVEVVEVAGRAIRRVRLRGPAVGRTPD
jgi:putative hemolysin